MQNLAHVERFQSCLESGTAKWEQQWEHKITLRVFILSEILENSREICLIIFFSQQETQTPYSINAKPE